jgi:hypothetical protein
MLFHTTHPRDLQAGGRLARKIAMTQGGALRHYAVMLAALMATGQANAINKCTGPDGKVVFQDAPCAGKGEAVRILGAGQADPNSQGAQYWQREVARQKRSAAIDEAIANRSVSIGMNSDEVIKSWGRPSKINKTVTSSGVQEQWVYNRGGHKTQYVYMDNGVVRTIQSPE